MSKLNPQKATAYVGPGVLKQGGKITPVPDGHLIKKTGKFKGSTLKSGGAIKKAQNSDVIAKEFEDNEKIKDSLFAKNRKLLNLFKGFSDKDHAFCDAAIEDLKAQLAASEKRVASQVAM